LVTLYVFVGLNHMDRVEIETVKICTSVEKAMKEFKSFTGVDYNDFLVSNDEYDKEDWIGSDWYDIKLTKSQEAEVALDIDALGEK
jgi:hypothetical protein